MIADGHGHFSTYLIVGQSVELPLTMRPQRDIGEGRLAFAVAFIG